MNWGRWGCGHECLSHSVTLRHTRRAGVADGVSSGPSVAWRCRLCGDETPLYLTGGRRTRLALGIAFSLLLSVKVQNLIQLFG